MRRKIWRLTIVVAVALAARQVSAAPQCNCSFCHNTPSAFCDISSFHTSCASYLRNFC